MVAHCFQRPVHSKRQKNVLPDLNIIITIGPVELHVYVRSWRYECFVLSQGSMIASASELIVNSSFPAAYVHRCMELRCQIVLINELAAYVEVDDDEE